MFSSERLRHWLQYAQEKAVAERIPVVGNEGAAVRGVAVRFLLDGEELLFCRIDGDQVVCLGLDDEGQYGPEKVIGLYDAWNARPRITEYWGLLQFNFDNWGSFSREQTFHWMRIRHHVRRLRFALRDKVRTFKKQVAVQRYAVLNTVKRLQHDGKVPTAWDVMSKLLGEDWVDHSDAFDRLGQVEAMLDALEQLGELSKNGIGYVVTGQGIATLSQYEEEERKHRESMGLQRGIRLLTVIMALAALLQAKVVNFPPLYDIKAWPWN